MSVFAFAKENRPPEKNSPCDTGGLDQNIIPVLPTSRLTQLLVGAGQETPGGLVTPSGVKTLSKMALLGKEGSGNGQCGARERSKVDRKLEKQNGKSTAVTGTSPVQTKPPIMRYTGGKRAKMLFIQN